MWSKIKTSFFVCDYTYGTPTADDDIAEVEWVTYEALKEDMFVEEHKVLFRMLKAKVVDPEIRMKELQNTRTSVPV